MVRAVVDTNVLVSGLLGGRATRPLLAVLHGQTVRLIVSPWLIEEFLRVTSRPRLEPYFSARARQAIVWYLHTQAHVVSPRRRVAVCRDPKGNVVLEAAVAGRADVIVTGDRDLLVLHPFRRMAILPPARFLQRLHEGHGFWPVLDRRA